MRISVFFDHILQAKEQTGKPLEELLTGVRQAGIEAVEICLDYLLSHEEVMDTLKQADLAISCIYEFYDMGRIDETQKACRHVEAAVKAGAGRILVVPGFLDGAESKQMQEKMSHVQEIEEFLSGNSQISRMVEGLSFISKLGREKNVVVTVEDFDDLNSPFSGMNGIRWFLGQIPELKYTLDTGNYLFYQENMLDAFSLFGDRIAHVHCKDRHKTDQASVEVGGGYIPFEDVICRLKAQGYDGYLAIEHFDAADQEGCMRKSAQFLHSKIHR